ncbi:MAG: DUF1735 and LamG domain-containing protein [Candidatus Cryptobacteroides sp.]
MNKYIKYVLCALLPLVYGCAKSPVAGPTFDNVVYIDVSSTSEEQITTIGNAVPSLSKQLAPVMAYPEDRDVHVTLDVDPSMVAVYNASHGTDYPLLEDKFYSFEKTDVLIPAGKVNGNEIITVAFKNLTGEGDAQEGAMALDRPALLPIRIVSSGQKILNGSSTAYYVVKRSSAISVVAQLGTGNWINFPSLDLWSDNSMALNGLTAVTYEAWVYFDSFLDRIIKPEGETEWVSISSIMGVEQSLLLRIGDTNYEREQIQFDGSGSYAAFGKFPKRDANKRLEAGKWYHIACTYDQTTRTVCLYVNGELQAQGLEMGVSAPTVDNRINLAMRALYDMWAKNPVPENEKYSKLSDAYRFCIAGSYDAYRPLNGKIAEARVWSVARTLDEIRSTLKTVDDPESHPELVGYWKFNEGSGNVIRDWSRYHNDGVAEKDIIWPVGMEVPILTFD